MSKTVLEKFESVDVLVNNAGFAIYGSVSDLTVDEIDEVLDQTWTKMLFDQLRALIYSGDLRNRIRLVIAGSRRFLDQSRGLVHLSLVLRVDGIAQVDQRRSHGLALVV